MTDKLTVNVDFSLLIKSPNMQGFFHMPARLCPLSSSDPNPEDTHAGLFVLHWVLA